MLELALIAAAALLAGFIDALVGGGGLVMTPALFGVFPQAAPATLLGTSKASGVWGTAFATLQFAKRVRIRWATMLPAVGVSFCAAMLGAWTVTRTSPDALRRLLPFVLLAVFLYTLAKKELGREHAPRHDGGSERIAACLIGAAIGFYDGFFGPGTGSFFVFLFVRVLGYDFLNASASAKLLNTATNFAAMLLFASTGHVWWHYAAVLATANVIGSVIGARMALRHGPGFVRGVFIAVVGLLICKTGYDAFLR
jgi:uncharacterized membrane protein YfcA